MAARTWTILSENVPTIEKLLTRLNKKAAKFGTTPLTMTLGARSTVKDGADVFYMIEATVTGTTPRLNGWEFVATIQHAGEAGNVIRTVPTFIGTIPPTFRTADPYCDHCKFNRRRNDTFIVFNETEDEYRQIGRNCLADFIGGDNVAGTMAMAEMWSLVSDGMSGAADYWGLGRGARTFDLEELLAFAAQVVLTEGWVPKGKAEELGKTSTAELTLTAIDKAYKNRDPKPELFPTTEAHALASKVLAWAPDWIERERSNDYVWNMSVVLASPYVPMRSVGLAVSAIGAYQRDMQRAVERAAKAQASPSQFLGSIGDKLTLTLTVKALRYIDNGYGTTLVTFTDTEGNVVKWFASNPGKLTEGNTANVTGTVKKHEEWQGIKSTVITRAKVK
jgi:hypothetical protein